MKVVAFNGSPRKKGNTSHAIQTVFEVLRREGIKTDLIQLGGSDNGGCRACYKCFEKKNSKCIPNDAFNLFNEKMIEAEGIMMQFEGVGRKDAAQKERDEIGIIRTYMPAQVTEDEIRVQAKEVIAQTGVIDLKGLGKVMGILSKKLAGRASGGDMSRIVKEELEKLH